MKRGLSARKRDRQNQRNRLRNRAVKSHLRTVVKKTAAEPTPDNLSKSYAVLDRAVKTRVLHKKTAGRMKSSLARHSAVQKPATDTEPK